MADRPPTRLSVQIQAPGGVVNRWGIDEPDPANVPTNLAFSTTMPGGFEQMSCALPRRADIDYSDLQEFSTITVYGAGGEIAWQGRLETTPRTSGDQLSITPGAVGWQAALDDEQNARMIYIDSDLTRWQTASVQRKLNILGSSADDEDAAGPTPDPTTGAPCLVQQITSPWARTRTCESWYDAKGIPLATVYYAWKQTSLGTSSPWSWQVYLSDDDILTAFDWSTSLAAAGPSSSSFSATTATRDWAMLSVSYGGASGAGDTGKAYQLFWTYLGIVGNHGLPIERTPDLTDRKGLFASDVIQHAVSTWAPELATTRNGISTIQQSTFVIPQLSFPDPTTVSNIIAAATQYGLVDWWVDEGPTFNLATRENHGRDWQARVGPSGLQETGPQVDHLYNAVVVAYNDTTGKSLSVGPTGSGANTIDNTLADNDPTNPVNAAGIDRTYLYPNIGVSTPAGATAVGQRFLAENAQRNTAGQAQIVGHVQDTTGVWWPSWAIRAGDNITFTDAHDTTPRRITRTQYSDSSRACQLDLDSPPQDLSQLLARYSIALTDLV